jgi:hypothetical protein
MFTYKRSLVTPLLLGKLILDYFCFKKMLPAHLRNLPNTELRRFDIPTRIDFQTDGRPEEGKMDLEFVCQEKL